MAKPRARVGRPTDLTPELQASIVRAVRTGSTFADAAELNGVTDRTLCSWMDRGRKNEEPFLQFFLAVTRARAQAKRKAIREVRAGVMMNHAKDWKAWAWWLERMYPEEFAAQSAVHVKVEKELTAVLDSLKAKLAPDVYNVVLEAIAGESSEGEADGAESGAEAAILQ